MKVSFADVGGARIRYYHEGAGEPLLLIHGFGASADCWAHTIDAFGERYRTIAPDLPGHGLSDRIDFGDEPPQIHLVHCLGRFMDALDIGRCAVVGSSLGSVLACLLHDARPHQVSRLVLVGSATVVSDLGTPNPDTIRAAMANGSKAMRAVSWEACIDRLANVFFHRDRAPADVALVHATAYALPDRLAAYTAIGEGIIAFAGDDRVKVRAEDIPVPVLILSGREDIRAPIDIIEKNYKRFPDVEKVTFTGCNHMPELEHPGEFTAAVLDFLSRR